LVLLGIFFVVQIAVTLLSTLVLLLAGRGAAELLPEEKGLYLAATTFVSMAVVMGLFVWYRRSRGAAPLQIGYSLNLKQLQIPLLAWALGLMMALGVLFEPLYELLPPLRQEVGRGWWSIVSVVVIAPLFEEFLCRGYLLGYLHKCYGATRAILFSALFFGVLHVQPVAVVNAFLMGVVLGVVYLATRTLWAPILLHAANNALAYLLIRSGSEQMTFYELLGGHKVLYGVCYAVAFCFCFWAAFRLWKLLPKGASTEENNPSM
jgi:membrane protease YdiL (CAAX protease family)